MRLNIKVRKVEMVSLRTSYVINKVLCLMSRSQCGIRHTLCNLRCSKDGRYHLRAERSGFTVIELVIVIVIIAIAAMVAIPIMSSASSFQIRSAANMIAADLEYAKTMAISKGRTFSVVFDVTAESYRIEDQNDTIIRHPVKKGFDYIVDFRNDSRLSKVDIETVDFDTTCQIKFDYLGSPSDGANNPLNTGVISLRAGQMTATINVEPVTGFISIQD
jgi:prepilin-type N-terminal cleavage/methylation domain-containing protein